MLILMGKIALLSSEFNHCLWHANPLTVTQVSCPSALVGFDSCGKDMAIEKEAFQMLLFDSCLLNIHSRSCYLMPWFQVLNSLNEGTSERCLEVKAHMNHITITHKSAASKPSGEIIVMHRPCFITVPHGFLLQNPDFQACSSLELSWVQILRQFWLHTTINSSGFSSLSHFRTIGWI